MNQPAANHGYGEQTRFEGQEYDVNKGAVGASHVILAGPVTKGTEVGIAARGVVVGVTFNAKGEREHKIEILEITVDPIMLRSV